MTLPLLWLMTKGCGTACFQSWTGSHGHVEWAACCPNLNPASVLCQRCRSLYENWRHKSFKAMPYRPMCKVPWNVLIYHTHLNFAWYLKLCLLMRGHTHWTDHIMVMDVMSIMSWHLLYVVISRNHLACTFVWVSGLYSLLVFHLLVPFSEH